MALAPRGRSDEAEAVLLAAHTGASKLGLRPMLWQIELALGQLCRAGRRRVDTESWFVAARSGVNALAANLAEIGLAEAFLREADRLLPEPGRATASEDRQASAEVRVLTSREREV